MTERVGLTRLELFGMGGITIAADAAGDPSDRPALLLHGGGQTRHSWRSTLQALGASGWYAISMDLRGHGDSEWSPDGEYTLDAFAGDVVSVAGQFDRPALVGASLGGTSALAALGASRDEPVGRALVLVDVAPQIEAEGAARIGQFMRAHTETGFGSLDEVADAIQAYNPHRARPSDLSGLRKNVRLGADERWYWHWDPKFVTNRLPRDSDESRAVHRVAQLEDAARSLTVPTLLIRGRQSDLLSEAGAMAFLELAPNSEFVDVGGAGHMVAGDRNDAFNDAVVRFLAHVQ